MLDLLPSSSEQAALIEQALFTLFAAIAGGSVLIVAVSRNIVRQAVALLFCLAAVAGLYFLLGAEFIAAAQLVIYAGGTLILIIFGVMLTSKSPFARFQANRSEMIVAAVLSFVLLGSLVAGVLLTPRTVIAPSPAQRYPMATLGQALLGDYLVPFELISILLLVVMVGAAYLAKARKPGDRDSGSAR